jgi:hypothetical protein
MKIFKMVLMAFYLCLVFNGSLVFSQSGEKSKGKSVSIPAKDKRTNSKKVEPGDYFPKNEIKSPFRYVIVDDYVRFDNNDDGKEQVPVDRFVRVLMEKRAFNKGNLIYLFKYLSNYYADPLYLDIEVHTSLMTLETLEESVAMSTHSSRDDFHQFYKTATYGRSNDIYERCGAGFDYDTGKPGKFTRKSVNLTCTTRK